MAQASYARTSFLGGEWSQTAQGRFLEPAYNSSLNVCVNAIPTEQGAWSRRSGTADAHQTRAGGKGRVIAFDVNESNPITLEFTDGYLRFRNGTQLIMSGPAQAVSAISTANPASVTVPIAPVSGASVMFSLLGTNDALLQNRIFVATYVDGTHFTIADDITGATIDGSTLGTFVSGSVSQILELTTPYAAGSWASLRSVQAENQAVFLNGTPPQVLELTSAIGATYPTFTLNPVNFIDGPYLDPFNGSICTYDVLQGNVTLTFSFQAWSAATSYSKGDYVVSGGQGYQSLQNANLNNSPPNATWWTPVNGGAPVGPNGFTSGDIGRHIRLFSEPPFWSSSATYASQAVVKYNNGYWQSLINANTNIIPGTSATSWVPVTGINYAQWTWGRIISVSGAGLVNVGTPIGSMTNTANAFNGTVSQASGNCATASTTVAAYAQLLDGGSYTANQINYNGGNFYQCTNSYAQWAPGAYFVGTYVEQLGILYLCIQANNGNFPPASHSNLWSAKGPAFLNSAVWSFYSVAPTASFDAYAGANFSASTKQIQSVTIFPSNDLGFGCPDNSFTFNLRAKQTAPSGPSDGTLLGSISGIAKFGGAQSIVSSDQTTSWAYVWIEMLASVSPFLPPNASNQYVLTGYLAQVEFFSPNVANGSVVKIQLAGPALLYQAGTVIFTWRAGLYSNTAGWPTCGCYDSEGGRLWLAGAVTNRADASQSNNIFNFAPTEPDGTVADNDAIAAVFNSKKVNTIFWMEPDAQGIVVGTDGGEFLVQRLAAGAITPTNIDVNPITQVKCANIEPVRTEHTLVAVQRRMRKIIEYFADVFSGKYTAPNLAEKARHLTGNFLQEVRYQQEITPTLWARDGAGNLIGASYKRDTLMTSQGPTFIGWHRHALGSGRVVESIAVGASQGGTLDALSMVTNDLSNGIRRVAVLADLFEETTPLQSAWMLDNAVTPSSYTVSGSGVTFNGLWHLNGKTVTVFAASLDCGDFAVSSGSLTVPYGDGISQGAGGGLFTQALVNSFPATQMPAVIGFTYNSDGQLTRPMSPQESGARTGPALGKKRRFDQYGMLITVAVGGISPETTTVTTATSATPGTAAGLQVGTSFANLRPANFRQADDVTPLAFGATFSGVHWDTLDDDASFDGMLCWRISRPWPCIISAVEPFGESQDK